MILFTNNATTTIAGAISPTSTQVNVAAGAGVLFPSPTGGDYFIVTLYKNDTSGLFEICHCTQRIVDTLTIVRGQEGTPGQQWNPGDSISSLITAGAMEEFLQQSQRGIDEAPLDGQPYARQSATWTPVVRQPDPVWPPTGWATSSWVYTGHDTGTKNALVVPVTTPDMTALAEGTLITVKVLQSSDGPSTLKIKNFPAYSIVMMNGEQIGAQLTAGNTMEFWFDGSKFYAPVHPAPTAGAAPGGDVPIDNPLPWHFHCHCDTGIDDIQICDGLSPQKAWKTLAYAIRCIETYYASRPKVHILCHPGPSGGDYGHCEITSPHVAEWEIEGYDSAPSVCVIQHSSNYGCRFSNCKVLIHGFYFNTWFHNIICDSNSVVTIRDCYIHEAQAPMTQNGARAAVMCQGGAVVVLGGQMHFRGIGSGPCDIVENYASTCNWGHEEEGLNCHFTFDTPCTFMHGPIWCHGNAFVNLWHDGCTWANVVNAHGPKFWCEAGSGFDGCKGDKNWWPGDQPGWCDDASFSYYR